MMKTEQSRRRPGTILLLVTGLLAAGCGGRNSDEEAGSAVEGAGSSQPASIITAFGTVVAADRQEIRLPWDCRVPDIPVWEGQRVEKGDLLAVLDSDDLDTALEDARLGAESARGLYEEAAARLAALDVSLTEAADRLERNMSLRDSGSVSQQELATLKAEYDGLVFDRAAAEWALKSRQNDADRARSAYRRLLERSEESYLSGNSLISPFDAAVVAEISLRPGAQAEAGELIMVLHDEASLMVEADLSEEFVRDVSSGAGVTIIPIADPERSYAGTVLELAGVARLVNGENTVKTRIRLDEQDGFLREGFNVDVEIRPGE